MKKYIPNYIERGLRVALTLFIALQIFVMLSELATGYVYIPARGGGVLLHGTSTLFLVFFSFVLILAALATIIDHYDRRQNERAYILFKYGCYIVAAILFCTAPIFAILENLLISHKINYFPVFNGFAEKYTIDTTALAPYIELISPILENKNPILIASFIFASIGYGLKKFQLTNSYNLSSAFCGIGGVFYSLVLLCENINSLYIGDIKFQNYYVYSNTEPAKFNALFLGKVSISIILLMASIYFLLKPFLIRENRHF